MIQYFKSGATISSATLSYGAILSDGATRSGGAILKGSVTPQPSPRSYA